MDDARCSPRHLRRIAAALTGRTALGAPTNRTDLPSVWLLRVSSRALDDLGVSPIVRENTRYLKERNPILRRFFDDLCAEARVDTGTPIQAVSNPKVFRIREEDERAAVWYDREHGVVWCCRVLSISNFPNEPRLENVIAALIAARDAAYHSPGAWHPAVMRDPAADEVEVGRAYVQRERLDDSGELVTRFVLVLGDWPKGLPQPGDWRQRIMAFCFDAGEPVEPAYNDLPDGTQLRTSMGEVPLMQRRLGSGARTAHGGAAPERPTPTDREQAARLGVELLGQGVDITVPGAVRVHMDRLLGAREAPSPRATSRGGGVRRALGSVDPAL